jgi:hypothetical protein
MATLGIWGGQIRTDIGMITQTLERTEGRRITALNWNFTNAGFPAKCEFDRLDEL